MGMIVSFLNDCFTKSDDRIETDFMTAQDWELLRLRFARSYCKCCIDNTCKFNDIDKNYHDQIR